MLKQSFSKAKKVLTILLAVLFVVSLTVGAASASACHLHGHHHSCGSCSSYGSPHSHTCGCSHSHPCGCSHGSCNDDTTCENDD
jgi:hypothetical protein